MKATWSTALVSGLLAAGAVQACSGTGVDFSTPGTAGGGRAGAAAAGSGNHAGAPAIAGSAGTAEPGAGSGGAAVAGADGDSGAPGGGVSNGGAPQAGAPNGGAPQAGAPNAGAPSGGAPQAGAPNAGAPNGGGGNPNPVCGNSILEGDEQCDDGNALRLDGCTPNCTFEQGQRSIWFKAQFAPDAFCAANGFGSAFPAATRVVLQQDLDARVSSGALSVLFAFVDLANPKGPNGSMFSLGVLYGSPVAGANYDGTSDSDWWYTPAAGTIDAQRKPVSQLPASIAGAVATTTLGKIVLPLLSDAPLSLSNASVRLPIGASTKPLSSTGAPPGHLAAEHLSATLTSFATGGAPTAAGSGELCGNISAESLKTQPIPADFVMGGASPCFQGYTQANTFLDVLVGGCNVSPGFTPALIATQPDQTDSSVPNPGTGGPYKLSTNAAHSVSICRDKDGQAVTLAACLTAAAYSTAYKFATDRVIIK